uniref:(northern house mosquito) hypothetical protein n=1 Tax=Culex pipiens TaxID=7175 RepID=A0A8D8DEP5_CULPI
MVSCFSWGNRPKPRTNSLSIVSITLKASFSSRGQRRSNSTSMSAEMLHKDNFSSFKQGRFRGTFMTFCATLTFHRLKRRSDSRRASKMSDQLSSEQLPNSSSRRFG